MRRGRERGTEEWLGCREEGRKGGREGGGKGGREGGREG